MDPRPSSPAWERQGQHRKAWEDLLPEQGSSPRYNVPNCGIWGGQNVSASFCCYLFLV